MKPTEEQSKEFWELCGLQTKHTFRALDFGEKECSNCGALKGGGFKYCTSMMPINPNNLFKYAVPKSIDKIMDEHECSSDLAYGILFKKWLQELELDMTHPANTLFWILYPVLKGESNGTSNKRKTKRVV